MQTPKRGAGEHIKERKAGMLSTDGENQERGAEDVAPCFSPSGCSVEFLVRRLVTSPIARSPLLGDSEPAYVFGLRHVKLRPRRSTARGRRSGVCWPIKPPPGLGSPPPHQLTGAGGSAYFPREAESQVEKAGLPAWPRGRLPHEEPNTKPSMNEHQMLFVLSH